MTNAKADPARKSQRQIDDDVDNEVVFEFGGSAGVVALMIVFPSLMIYFCACLLFNNGAMILPRSLAEVQGYLAASAPTPYAYQLYCLFCALQLLLSMVMPGPVVHGMPVPSEGNKSLPYLCNGVAAWYFTLAAAAALHFSRVLPITDIIDNIYPITSVSIIVGNVMTFLTYFGTLAIGKSHRMSGHLFYDYFMGAPLNPRFFNVDLKMWAEIRVPWPILFFISVSAAVKQYETIGRFTPELLFMCLAHFLYVNACMKGEECIPTTWDIFYEKWGYMLIFWNMSGVPFTYCYSSIYLLHNGPVNSPVWYNLLLVAALLGAYYVWDTANSQKNRFRMMERGTYIERATFPQLPWGTLADPKYILTEHGSKLLIGGWWGYARKIHYTADLVMAATWGLVTGFGSGLPYFYLCFFIIVLAHRTSRDMEKCAKKYGKDWDRYCKAVPYTFVPGVY